MASILRSSKFVRYIAGFARNIVVNTPREFDGNVINNNAQCFCGAVPRGFTTQASVQQHEQNLDSYIKRLDQDVRRSGRISRRDIEDVLEEIKSSRSATSSQSLLVIRCCGNLVPEESPETRTKLVQEIWNTLKKLNVPMDISHYNALLRVYLENEYEFSPTDFLGELESNGIEPNRVTYQRLISRYCHNGDIEGATRILEFMREKQLPVNENVFNALINGHSQLNDMDSAYGILGVMLQAGLEPSADTYTTLLAGYAKQGDFEMIEKIFQECDEKEIHLLDKDYLDIAYALIVNGHEKYLENILRKVRKSFGYNQDAINICLRLINKGFIDNAYEIMQTMVRSPRADGSVSSSGAFFLRHMVKKSDNDPQKIVALCEKLEKDQLFENALMYATEMALEAGNCVIAYGLMDEMKNKGLPVRNHYFWPLILAKSKSKDDDAILGILAEMIRFGVFPNNETIREYVIPNLQGRSKEILGKLRSINVSIGSASCSLAYHLLQKGDMVEASWVIQNVPAYYVPDLIRRPLSNALYKTKDFSNYALILRHIYQNLDRKSEVENDENASIDKHETMGRFILDLTFQRNFHEVIQDVLVAVSEQGLSISSSAANRLEEKLGERMTPELSSLLARMSTGELIPAPIETRGPIYTPSTQMNIPQLEKLIENLDAKKQDTTNLKKQLMTLYYRNKELEKMKELYKEFEKLPDFTYTTGVYAQLLDVSAHLENLEETLNYLQKLNELEPNFTLDDMKTLRVATVLAKNGRFEEAVSFLKRPRDVKEESDKSFSLNSMCWRLMNYYADVGDVEKLLVVFDALLANNYIEVNNVNLGPLVKVHIVNGDVEKALERFEWCCNQYRATPWKNELACRLIQTEDAEKLQRLTDLSTSVHGEINSLYDLVFAFVECGRVRQARKILETPGLQSRPQKINTACQRYRTEGMIKPLEILCEATKDLNHIDRSDIYFQLLLSYIKQNDPTKCLGLWTQMQEEDIPPTDGFLITLGKYLRSNNIELPFAMPHTAQTTSSGHATNEPFLKSATKREITVLRRAIKEGDVDTALKIKSATNEPLSTTDVSQLIEKLVQTDKTAEAVKLLLESLDLNVVPITRVFRFLLNKLANNGEVESIERIGAKLNADVKKLVSLDNRVCHANVVAGKVEQYLQTLEAEITNAKEEDLERLSEKFPRGGAVGILERHPELIERYETLAVKYAKRGIMAPVNVLWSHYFINGPTEKAETLWDEYLKGVPRVMFQRIVQTARETNDEALTQKLIEHLKNSKVTDGALGNAYSCLIDVLAYKQKDTETVETFEKAVKAVSIEFLNRTAVLRAKECFDRLQKPFTYKIPPKNAKAVLAGQTSSSSSSSEEDAAGRK